MTTELSLRDYIDLLRRRLPVVLGCFLAMLLAAFAYSTLQTPLYRSSANILINQNTSNDIFDPVSGLPTNYADRVAANEVKLLQSQLVRTEAEQRLGFAADISASADSQADFVTVRAVNADPEIARQIAQTYAESYLDVRRNEFVAERLETAAKLRERIIELEAEIDAKVASSGDDADVRQEEALRDDLNDSIQRLQITADLGNNGSARITDDAEAASAPFSPRTNRNVVLGGILGLMMGAAAALILETLDRTIKSRGDLEAMTPGVPALTVIPDFKEDHDLISLAKPDGPDSEVFRLLRAGIQFASVDKSLQIIQITSPGPSAGKTTVAANLAVVMAQAGQRVAVIDGDLRRPQLHKLFNVEQVPGFSSLIIGQEKGSGASHALSLNNGGLWVFPSGPVPPGPSELLGSKRAARTLSTLRKSLDVIIIDTPPVLPVSDALVVSRLVDATIVVANAKLTKRDEIERAIEQLDQAGANVVGTVLNQVKMRKGGVFGYGYGYGYGQGYGYGYGGPDTGTNWFGRSKNVAPRHEGTKTIGSSELPRFEAARPFERPSPDQPALVSAQNPAVAAPVAQPAPSAKEAVSQKASGSKKPKKPTKAKKSATAVAAASKTKKADVGTGESRDAKSDDAESEDTAFSDAMDSSASSTSDGSQDSDVPETVAADIANLMGDISDASAIDVPTASNGAAGAEGSTETSSSNGYKPEDDKGGDLDSPGGVEPSATAEDPADADATEDAAGENTEESERDETDVAEIPEGWADEVVVD